METKLAWIHEFENSGKAIDELSMRQVKDNAVKALSFTELYGLTADTLTMPTASGKSVRSHFSF